MGVLVLVQTIANLYLPKKARLPAPAVLYVCGHGPTVIAFVIGPDEARVRLHFDVLAEERHGIRGLAAELETVPAPDTNIRLAGQQGHACRLGRPPPLQELRFCPRIKNDLRGRFKSAGDDQLTVGILRQR